MQFVTHSVTEQISEEGAILDALKSTKDGKVALKVYKEVKNQVQGQIREIYGKDLKAVSICSISPHCFLAALAALYLPLITD